MKSLSNNDNEQLSQDQLERQDWVDNAIHQCLADVTERWIDLEWDIDLIGEVRDSIERALVDRGLIPQSGEFYPSIQIKEGDNDDL